MFVVINIATKEEKLFANFTAAIMWVKKMGGFEKYQITER